MKRQEAFIFLLAFVGMSATSYGQDLKGVGRALPSLPDLPGFMQVMANKEGKDALNASSFHRRKNDGLQLSVDIDISSDEAKAKAAVKEFLSFASSPMIPSSVTKRSIGQSTWRSNYKAGQKSCDTFMMIVQDGRSMVVINIMLPISKGVNGVAIRRELSRNDFVFVENVALKCLDKLSKMNYTKVHKPK
jgi:hypothetical protein